MGLEAVHSLESAGSVLQPHPTVDLGLSRLADLRASLERLAACLPVGDSTEHLETQVLHAQIFLLIFNIQVESAHAWRERTAQIFLNENSQYSLLEVLSPRWVRVEIRVKLIKFEIHGQSVIRYEFESGEAAAKKMRLGGEEKESPKTWSSHPIFQATMLMEPLLT